MRVVVLALVACTPPALEPLPMGAEHVAAIEYHLRPATKLDVLFVIDRSPAIAPHVENVARSLPWLVDNLFADLHVGVVSADLGSTGARDAVPGPALGEGAGACIGRGEGGALTSSELVDGSFIVDVPLTDGTHLRNYDGDLATAFTSLADLHADGCTYSQPLEAMRRALASHPTFVRADAGLAVVFLLGTDDCSFAHTTFTNGELDAARCARTPELVPLDEYVALLQAVKPFGHLLLAAALPMEPCGEASARMDSLFARVEHYKRTTPICLPDLSYARPEFPSWGVNSANPCITSTLVDFEPSLLGLQPFCEAELRQHGIFERLPPCDERGAPCWVIREDERGCPIDKLSFDVIRPLLDLAPDAYVRAQCLAEPQ